MVLARAILWLLALGFAGFGAAYTFWPTTMAALTDIALPSKSARIDFAATYAGLQLGFATFLTLCAGARRGFEQVWWHVPVRCWVSLRPEGAVAPATSSA